LLNIIQVRHLSAFANKGINLILFAIVEKINRQTMPISCTDFLGYRFHILREFNVFSPHFLGRLRAFSASPQPVAGCSKAKRSS
jgi:hypothetical protein